MENLTNKNLGERILLPEPCESWSLVECWNILSSCLYSTLHHCKVFK